jgi:hypothetical protein
MGVIINIKKSAVSNALSTAEALTPHSPSGQIRDVLRSAVLEKLDSIDIGKLCRVISKRTELSVKDVRSTYKDLAAAMQGTAEDHQLALARHVLKTAFQEGAHLKVTPDGHLFRYCGRPLDGSVFPSDPGRNMKLYDIIVALEALGSPSSWPRRVRRAFLLTLPVSGPTWLALNVIAWSGAAVALFAWVIFYAAHDAAQAAAKFWGRP